MADPAKVVRYSLWLSRSYADAGDHARAGAALADALRHGDVRVDLPSRAAAAFAIARAHAANGRIDQAIRHTDRALALYDLRDDNQALRESHLVYAQALLDISDVTAAAGHLSAARGLLEAEPESLRSWAHSRSRRPAWRCFLEIPRRLRPRRSTPSRCCRSPPTRDASVMPTWCWPASRTSLARLSAPSASYTRAVEEFTATGNQRELAKAYRWFGKFLKRLGRADAALEAFELAADLTPSTLDSLAPVLEPQAPFPRGRHAAARCLRRAICCIVSRFSCTTGMML